MGVELVQRSGVSNVVGQAYNSSCNFGKVCKSHGTHASQNMLVGFIRASKRGSSRVRNKTRQL